ncbi:tetratricopeptide repeat protein [Dyadobacter sp. CY261]|uniref:tetratricopeptide repeat protein n=1 Tax=Dyadobacter sp. CY261 TaxID=2907203 RepID=UPI001F1E02F8|nr:tetratricopeptide repeat protein [Dyadobacter sp. CY261]MCF0070113.1 tetratricopeptide repeat protein [Dyadobacter sp. CY261]
MNNTLLTNLQAFYDEDPADPFNAYALAIEYTKSDLKEAQRFFNILLEKHSDYLPTYYHAGAFFAGIENVAKAEEIYQKGVKLALLQGNAKTHRELVSAYNNFLDEWED